MLNLSSPMRLTILATLLAAALPAAAQQRATDETFTAVALADALSGQTAEFFDTSLASYAADGSYAYRYRPEEPPFIGTWEATEDSQVCVVFNNGFSRCDTIVQAGERLTMIVENGDRYPIRTLTPIE
ncbi:MAG: hypothetical protein AAFR35_12965 [Pseudomonadota bacterium]